MSGRLSERTSLSAVSNLFQTTRSQQLLILMIGFVAMASHEYFKFGLSMPGRQGLTLMAVFALVRLMGPFSYTGTLAASGGVLAAVLVREHPVGAMVVLMQGVFIDVLFHQVKQRNWTFALLPLITGLAHTIKPVTKLGLMVGAGVETDSLRHGLLFPVATHFVFGATGGLAGYLCWLGWKKAQNNTDNKSKP